ncbi:hypothetical protein D3C87_1414600 [compost metagenome]
MHQRFHDAQHHIGCQVAVLLRDLGPMQFQQMPHAAVDVLVGQAVVARRVEQRKLAFKHPVQGGFQQMRMQHGLHDGRHALLQRRGGVGVQHLVDDIQHVVVVALMQRGDQRILVRKILVQRPDADPSRFGDQIGVGAGIAVRGQNASRGLQDRVDGVLGPELARRFSGLRDSGHGCVERRVSNLSNGS